MKKVILIALMAIVCNVSAQQQKFTNVNVIDACHSVHFKAQVNGSINNYQLLSLKERRGLTKKELKHVRDFIKKVLVYGQVVIKHVDNTNNVIVYVDINGDGKLDNFNFWLIDKCFVELNFKHPTKYVCPKPIIAD